MHVQAPVEVSEEDLLAVVPTLRGLVRCADRHHASNARHAAMVPNRAPPVKSLGDCPLRVPSGRRSRLSYPLSSRKRLFFLLNLPNLTPACALRLQSYARMEVEWVGLDPRVELDSAARARRNAYESLPTSSRSHRCFERDGLTPGSIGSTV
jgi:hypothetical protein